MCNGPIMSVMNKHIIEKQEESFFHNIFYFFNFFLEIKENENI